MIAITFEMAVRTVLLSSFLGIVSGVLYTLVYALIDLFISFVKRISGSDYSRDKGTDIKFSNIIDFLFFIMLGILYVLVNYVTCDGTILIYPIVFLVVFFMLSHLFLRKILRAR